jgi:hypothetical protein
MTNPSKSAQFLGLYLLLHRDNCQNDDLFLIHVAQDGYYMTRCSGEGK